MLTKLNLNCDMLNNIPMWVYIILGIFFIFLLYNFFNSNSDNFTDNTKLSKPDLIIYNFNTKWCHWSNNFRPEWNKFMESIKLIKMSNPNFNVDAVDVDCEDPKNDFLKNKYNIPGYPYILIETKDGSTIEYNNKRTSDELLKTINEML